MMYQKHRKYKKESNDTFVTEKHITKNLFKFRSGLNTIMEKL
jgi:hypothetical protein